MHFRLRQGPYVFDPANPTNNLYADVDSWGEVREVAEDTLRKPLLCDVQVTDNWSNVNCTSCFVFLFCFVSACLVSVSFCLYIYIYNFFSREVYCGTCDKIIINTYFLCFTLKERMNHEIDVTYSTIDPASIDRLCISFIWKFSL